MSGPTAAATAEVELDLGHPVRSFVVVLTVSGLLLLALQWTGAVHPQIQAGETGSAELAGDTVVVIEVRNDGALPVRVEDLRWPVERSADSVIGLAPSTSVPGGGSVSYALAPFVPFTLDGGASRWIGIRITPECSASLGSPRIRVRTATNLRRWIDLDQLDRDVQGGC